MTAFEQVWSEYKAARTIANTWPYDQPWPDDTEWAERQHHAAVYDWADVDIHDHDGVEHRVPILRYTTDKVWDRAERRYIYLATTEPCIYCGVKHHHGAGYDDNGDGHRSAHCMPHSHDFTPTGRRKNIYAKSTIACPGCGSTTGYILKRAKRAQAGAA